MRSKEDAHDYRYFPDPDLPPLVIADDWVARIQAAMPELPAHKRARFEHELGLTGYDAAQLTMNRDTSDSFEQTAAQAPPRQSKLAANWVQGELSDRSEKRRDGNEWAGTGRSRWGPAS